MEERGGRVCKKNWPGKEKRKYTKERREKATKSRADIKKEKKEGKIPGSVSVSGGGADSGAATILPHHHQRKKGKEEEEEGMAGISLGGRGDYSRECGDFFLFFGLLSTLAL